VAGGVPDREEDRPVLRAGPLERLVAPGEPVDGVVGEPEDAPEPDEEPREDDDPGLSAEESLGLLPPD
jgi:hypothetical protein